MCKLDNSYLTNIALLLRTPKIPFIRNILLPSNSSETLVFIYQTPRRGIL